MTTEHHHDRPEPENRWVFRRHRRDPMEPFHNARCTYCNTTFMQGQLHSCEAQARAAFQHLGKGLQSQAAATSIMYRSNPS